MDDQTKLFDRLFEEHVHGTILVYRGCAYALPPATIPTHLRENHQNLKAPERKLLCELIGGMSLLARNVEDINWPAPTDKSIPAIRVVTSFACSVPNEHGRECGYICGNEKTLDVHLYRSQRL